MTFDNSRTIIGIRIRIFAATVALLAYLAMAYVIKMIKFPVLGVNDTIITIILIGIWLFLALMPVIFNYQYISFSDEEDLIMFRYFTAGITGGKKNSIEIKKAAFAGYKIEKKFFGRIQSIILYQKIRQGNAKYPPVHISALTREEKAKVIRSLNQYSPQV